MHRCFSQRLEFDLCLTVITQHSSHFLTKRDQVLTINEYKIIKPYFNRVFGKTLSKLSGVFKIKLFVAISYRLFYLLLCGRPPAHR